MSNAETDSAQAEVIEAPVEDQAEEQVEEQAEEQAEEREPLAAAPEAAEEAPDQEETDQTPIDAAFETMAAAGIDEDTLHRMADAMSGEPEPPAEAVDHSLVEEASAADRMRFQVITSQIQESIRSGNRSYQAMETEYNTNKTRIGSLKEEGEYGNEYENLVGRQKLLESESHRLNQFLDGQESRGDALRQLSQITQTHPFLKQFPSTYGEMVRVGAIKPTDPPANQIRALKQQLAKAGVLKGDAGTPKSALPKSVASKLKAMKTSLGGKTGSDVGRGAPTGARKSGGKSVTGDRDRDSRINSEMKKIMRNEAMG